ncbi:WD repeat-containing protein 11 [Schistosoma japonicum]|nr:WD repeat-containing protein 11 [Schistosoma japonicum]
MRPRVIAFGISPEACVAVDYGWKGLVALASFTNILIVDPLSSKAIQSLQGHCSNVINVLWAPENYYHDDKNPFQLKLASFDSSGVIIIWDATTASSTSEFQETDSLVLEILWLPNQWVSRDLLAALHSHGKFIIWNSQTKTKLWKYTFWDSAVSFSLDPFSNSRIIFYSKEQFVVETFSVTSCAFGKATRLNISGDDSIMHLINETNSRGKGLAAEPAKLAHSELNLSLVNSERVCDSSSDTGKLTSTRTCLQVIYHGYHKDCALFVFKREIIIMNLRLSRPFHVITLDYSWPSFLRVYSCTQRDIIICLHENGNLSVYAHRGLALSVDTFLPQSHLLQKPRKESSDLHFDNGCTYALVAIAASFRRPKLSHYVNFSVDRMNELNIVVPSLDGHVQFWKLRAVQGPVLADKKSKPIWTLSDLLPHAPVVDKPPVRLYLELNGLYSPNRSELTVCSVCPPNIMKFEMITSICGPLMAVGNNRGDVQIWDMSSAMIWREYHVLSAPIKGIEWIAIPLSIYKNNQSSDNSLRSPSSEYSLGLIIYGWLSKDAHQSCLAENTPNKTNPTGKNFVTTLDLLTGYMRIFRDVSNQKIGKRSSGIGIGGSVGQLLSKSSAQESLLEGPIDILCVSHLSQYVGIAVRKSSVEIWKLHNSSLIMKLPLLPGVTAVALDWCHSPTKYHRSRKMSNTKSSEDNVHSKESRTRESCIMCTSDGNIRLVAVNNDSVDSTSVSNTILNGLPSVSLNRINSVAWFSDLVAFGTCDGFVAVRDLHTKRTLFRTTCPKLQLSYLDQALGTFTEQYFDPDMRLEANIPTVHPSLNIRRLCFTPGLSTFTRLLSLQFDSVCVWEPRQMLLLCMIEYSGSIYRSLVSADWLSVITTSSDRAFCVLLSGDGALRLVQAGQANYEMTVNYYSNQSVNLGTTFTRGTTLQDPISKFHIQSALPDKPDIQDPVLVPSLLPSIAALNIRHLLQHQPWSKKFQNISSLNNDNLLIDITSNSSITTPTPKSPNIDLVSQSEVTNDRINKTTTDDSDRSSFFLTNYPLLAPGFAKIQNSVNMFLWGLESRHELFTSFMNPSDFTIIERCLWTAQLFGDVYEVKFWRLVANRLLYKRSVHNNSQTADNHLWSRYFLDLSWDFLTDCDLYRQNVEKFISFMEKSHNSPSEIIDCVDALIMIGQQDRAVSLLLELPPDSNNYSMNMYRACLYTVNVARTSQLSRSGVVVNQLAEDNYLSVVKLVATNLLSNGLINDGINLLCLIGLQVDACRYLESFDQWDRSVWLAKCTLSNEEHDKVMRRWASYLASPQVNRRDLALFIYVYLEDHNAVLKLLFNLSQYQLAVRYLEACYELGVLKSTEETGKLFYSPC